MALFTIGAELTAMDVGVAVCAFGAHIGEDKFCVALHTLHLCVHAAQRITGPVVIELRNTSDGLPAGEGVAILARDGDVAVRVLRRGPGRRTVLWEDRGMQSEQEQ